MKRLALLLLLLPMAGNALPIDPPGRDAVRNQWNVVSMHCERNEDVGCDFELRDQGRILQRLMARAIAESCFECLSLYGYQGTWQMDVGPFLRYLGRSNWPRKSSSRMSGNSVGPLTMVSVASFKPDADINNDPEENTRRVAEPSTLALLAIGLAAIGFASRRRKVLVRQ